MYSQFVTTAKKLKINPVSVIASLTPLKIKSSFSFFSLHTHKFLVSRSLLP